MRCGSRRVCWRALLKFQIPNLKFHMSSVKCPMSNVMRVDLFLKASRLATRRTVAQRLCDAGLILVNDKPKSAHPVKPGDRITIQRPGRITIVRVLALPSSRRTSRTEAAHLHEVLSEDRVSFPADLSLANSDS